MAETKKEGLSALADDDNPANTDGDPNPSRHETLAAAMTARRERGGVMADNDGLPRELAEAALTAAGLYALPAPPVPAGLGPVDTAEWRRLVQAAYGQVLQRRRVEALERIADALADPAWGLPGVVFHLEDLGR